jgi:hypothetical protein
MTWRAVHARSYIGRRHVVLGSLHEAAHVGHVNGGEEEAADADAHLDKVLGARSAVGAAASEAGD